MLSKEKIYAVQRMQDYIETNIREPITLSELAKCAFYSPYHCSRMFKEFIGITPFEYIRRMRLTRAAMKLRDENTKVVSVAFDFMFDSHEGFTRAFSKEFGMSPKIYKNTTPPIRLFMSYPIRDRYIYDMKRKNKISKISPTGNTVFVQIIERPARKLMLKRVKKATNYLEYCEEIGHNEWYNLWGLLTSVKEALYEPIGLWLPENMRTEGTGIYAQGVELPIDYTGNVPEGLEIMELAPANIMIFQGHPFSDEYFYEEIENIMEIIRNYDPKIYGFEWDDSAAPRFQLEPQGYRGYIEGRPVKQIK